jgi:hypothetical protein
VIRRNPVRPGPASQGRPHRAWAVYVQCPQHGGQEPRPLLRADGTPYVMDREGTPAIDHPLRLKPGAPVPPPRTGAWFGAQDERFGFCSLCGTEGKLKQVDVPRGNRTKSGKPLERCTGKCLGGNPNGSCECQCRGKCHGAGVCTCGQGATAPPPRSNPGGDSRRRELERLAAQGDPVALAALAAERARTDNADALYAEWQATKDEGALERLLQNLGAHGRLWAAVVTGPYQKVFVRLFNPEWQNPRGRGAQFFREYTTWGETQWTSPWSGQVHTNRTSMDLKAMGPRGRLRQLLEHLRTTYGARSRHLELREELEQQDSPLVQDGRTWAMHVRQHAREQREAGVIGWNPPRGDEERRRLERLAAQGDPAAQAALGREQARMHPHANEVALEDQISAAIRGAVAALGAEGVDENAAFRFVVSLAAPTGYRAQQSGYADSGVTSLPHGARGRTYPPVEQVYVRALATRNGDVVTIIFGDRSLPTDFRDPETNAVARVVTNNRTLGALSDMLWRAQYGR